MIEKFGLALLTMFGIGRIKYAPGTVASFFTCLIYYTFFYHYTYDPGYSPDGIYFLWNNYIYLIFIYLILFIYSIILIDKLSHHFKKRDPKEIVIDEFFGQSIPLFFYFLIAKFQWITKRGQVDYDSFLENPELWIFLSFILFRIFDIFKPYPINIIDKKVKNGLGVMLDDIIAGIYATIIVIILFILWF